MSSPSRSEFSLERDIEDVDVLFGKYVTNLLLILLKTDVVQAVLRPAA